MSLWFGLEVLSPASNEIFKCSLKEAHVLVVENERCADAKSSRKDHRAVRENPETGVRTKLNFSWSSPRKLVEWIAKYRNEHNKCNFHIEEIEDEFHKEEKRWWIITNGHKDELSPSQASVSFVFCHFQHCQPDHSLGLFHGLGTM